MSGLEVETTLVIRSASPERVAEAVAQLRSLREFVLRPLPAVALHDAYLDIAGELLRAAGLGLRVRRIGRRQLLTLKGPARHTDGAVVRDEFEQPWSPSTLAEACARMVAFGVPLREFSSVAAADPMATLGQLGFLVTQRRETMRRLRDVREQRGPPAPLAEIAIDAVAFRFGDRTVWHHEIEIEAKRGDGGTAIRGIADAIMARWGSEMRVWPYGKLATGRAIEVLLRTRPLEDVIDEEGRLLKETYDQLEQRLPQP